MLRGKKRCDRTRDSILFVQRSLAQSHRQRRRSLACTCQCYMSPFTRRVMNGMHNVEHVISQFAACTMWATRTQGIGHVSDSQAATVLCITVCQRYILPRLLSRFSYAHSSAKTVGIRYAQCPF